MVQQRKNDEYDWFDDPFDDKKTAEELERARGPKMVGCLLGVVVLAALALVGFAVVGIATIGAGVGA